MQKVFNVLTVISCGAVTIGTAAGVYVYTQREAITDNVKSQITGMITDAVGGAVGDIPNLVGGNSAGGGLPAPSSPAGSGLPVPF